MRSWLGKLSAAFVLAGVSFGAFVVLSGKTGVQLQADAMKLRPTIDAFVGQGQQALATLIETANAPSHREPRARMPDGRAKLPFIVIEPKDFAEPMVARRDAAPGLRLTQAPDQLPLDLNPVEARLRARVSQELIQYFDLFLYVSKATPDKGSWAQRMFVLAKEAEGSQNFRLVHNWPVSTGQEEVVEAPSGRKLQTHTPQGMFKLDRGRFYEDYTSRQWQSPMPYAMFFDWRTEGRPSGLAIHGTDEAGQKVLGQRASHGCIRLSPENARILFEMIQSKYRGKVPVFEINANSGTMSTAGAIVRDENGKPKMTNGYKVLVFIEDYGGPTVDTVAALF